VRVQTEGAQTHGGRGHWAQKWLSAKGKYDRNTERNVNLMLAVKYLQMERKQPHLSNEFHGCENELKVYRRKYSLCWAFSVCEKR